MQKHGVSLADAEGVFHDLFAIHMEDVDAEGEQRFLAVGLGNACRVLVVSYTQRGEDIRIISVRRASRSERQQYESGIRLF